MNPTVRRASPLPLLALLALLPLSLSAQGGPPEEGEDGARSHLELAARYTSLRSQGAVLLGGAARLDLGGAFTFGGGGWLLTDPVEVAAGEPGTGLRLKVAYGGVLTGWEILETGRFRGGARILWGAGNAKLELPVVRTEIAADNFLVVEPGLTGQLRLSGPLRLHGEVAYRWATAVEDLPGVATDQLRGLSASLGLAIGPF